jgi:drug/metabolite transporter (DMT)-like permease
MIRAARTFPVFFLGLAALCWGVSTALSKLAVEQITSLDLFAVEVSTGALFLGAAAYARGARPRLPSREVVALGVIEPGLAFLLFDIGITHTAATHGALLLSTDTLFTIALAWALLDERIDRRIVIALAAGLAGSVLVSLSGDGGMSTLTGDLLVVAASLSAAGYAVVAKRAAARHDPLALTAGQMLVAAALALPLAAVAALDHHSHLGHAAAGGLLLAVAVGVLASVVPFVLYNAAIDRVTVSISGLVLTLVPLFGALASVVVVGESLAAWQLVGGALVVAAAGIAGTAA